MVQRIKDHYHYHLSLHPLMELLLGSYIHLHICRDLYMPTLRYGMSTCQYSLSYTDRQITSEISGGATGLLIQWNDRPLSLDSCKHTSGGGTSMNGVSAFFRMAVQ